MKKNNKEQIDKVWKNLFKKISDAQKEVYEKKQ